MVVLIVAVVIISVIGVLMIGYLVASFKGFAQEEEMFVIEKYGKFDRVVGPGMVFIVPFIEKVRAIQNIWEQVIPLFAEPIKIDFRDGSAVPQGAQAFVAMHFPNREYDAGDGKMESGAYRATYMIGDWRKAIAKRLENALRSYLTGLKIDEGTTDAKAGYDLTTGDRIPAGEIDGIKEAILVWGFDLRVVTIGDFDLGEDLIKARGELHRAERQMEAAKMLMVTRARETTGTMIQMLAESTGKTFEEVQAEVAADPVLKARITTFAEELVTRQMSIDGKALIDIRAGGGGDLEQVLLRIMAAFRRGTGGS